MKFSLPILFALGTALCWGLYGPTLENARSPERLWSPFKPYVGIGIAYLVWAIVGGLVAMSMFKDSYAFTGKEAAAGIWGFAAGTLGALGALSLTSAMVSFHGPPRAELVMPIVFGGAVSVMATVKAIQYRFEGTNVWLWVGILGVALCSALVAYNTPHAGHKKPAESSATQSAEQIAETSAESTG